MNVLLRSSTWCIRSQWSKLLMSGLINHDLIYDFTVNKDLPGLETFLSCKEEKGQDLIISWEFKYEKVKPSNSLATWKKILLSFSSSDLLLIGISYRKEGKKECTFLNAVIQTLQWLIVYECQEFWTWVIHPNFSTQNAFCWFF